MQVKSESGLRIVPLGSFNNYVDKKRVVGVSKKSTLGRKVVHGSYGHKFEEGN